MPVNAIAFVFGVWFLQQQPALPSSVALGALAVAALALAAAGYFTGQAMPPPGLPSPRIGLDGVSFAVACCLLGFFWAGMAAERRLADALSPDAEMRDVHV